MPWSWTGERNSFQKMDQLQQGLDWLHSHSTNKQGGDIRGCMPTSRDRFSKLKKADVSTLLIKDRAFPYLTNNKGLAERGIESALPALT